MDHRCAAHDCTYGSTYVACRVCGRTWELQIPVDDLGDLHYERARWLVSPRPVLGPAALARQAARIERRRAS